jgi:hypothetical protein
MIVNIRSSLEYSVTIDHKSICKSVWNMFCLWKAKNMATERKFGVMAIKFHVVSICITWNCIEMKDQVSLVLWHVDPFLGNASVNKSAINTQPTIEQTNFKATPALLARNNRTGVAGVVFYVVRIYPFLGNGCVFCAVVRPRLYNE